MSTGNEDPAGTDLIGWTVVVVMVIALLALMLWIITPLP